MCERNIPAGETWECATYEMLDSDLSADWRVLKCQNFNFLQTVTPSHTLWPSAAPSHCQHSLLPSFLVLCGFDFYWCSAVKFHKDQGCVKPKYCVATTFFLAFPSIRTNYSPLSTHIELLGIAGGGVAWPSHFPEMLQPIPKLLANEGGSFSTHAVFLQ